VKYSEEDLMCSLVEEGHIPHRRLRAYLSDFYLSGFSTIERDVTEGVVPGGRD
jgi:hypothetical protein